MCRQGHTCIRSQVRLPFSAIALLSAVVDWVALYRRGRSSTYYDTTLPQLDPISPARPAPGELDGVSDSAGYAIGLHTAIAPANGRWAWPAYAHRRRREFQREICHFPCLRCKRLLSCNATQPSGAKIGHTSGKASPLAGTSVLNADICCSSSVLDWTGSCRNPCSPCAALEGLISGALLEVLGDFAGDGSSRSCGDWNWCFDDGLSVEASVFAEVLAHGQVFIAASIEARDDCRDVTLD
jgi:hypothetical protein